jgi:hypothetical protein
MCGELAFVEKDKKGFWYFTTDKGYDFRESDRGVTSRSVMLVILRQYDAETRENQKHETNKRH